MAPSDMEPEDWNQTDCYGCDGSGIYVGNNTDDWNPDADYITEPVIIYDDAEGMTWDQVDVTVNPDAEYDFSIAGDDAVPLEDAFVVSTDDMADDGYYYGEE